MRPSSWPVSIKRWDNGESWLAFDSNFVDASSLSTAALFGQPVNFGLPGNFLLSHFRRNRPTQTTATPTAFLTNAISTVGSAATATKMASWTIVKFSMAPAKTAMPMVFPTTATKIAMGTASTTTVKRQNSTATTTASKTFAKRPSPESWATTSTTLILPAPRPLHESIQD